MRIVVRAMTGPGVGSLPEAVRRPATGLDVGEYADAARGDSSRTGRMGIWEGVRAATALRPWLGYGSSAFRRPDTTAAETIRLAMHRQILSAQGGYLETLARLGRVGLGFVAAVVAAVARTGLAVRTVGAVAALLAARG